VTMYAFMILIISGSDTSVPADSEYSNQG